MMFRRPIEPQGTSGGPLTPWLVVIGAWSAIAAIWLAWVAGRIAAAVSGHPGVGPDFGASFVGGLLRQDWQQLWPATSGWLVLAIYVLFVAGMAALVWAAWTWWLRVRPMGDDPLPSLADRRAIASLSVGQIIAKAKRLRPSLAATPASLIRAGEAGIALGEHIPGRMLGRRRTGQILYASLEDVVIAVMAPRAGKTTALTAPGILDAPGAVVATSNKPDVWTTTSAAREAKGTVFVFDPQAITHTDRSWWWNPLTLTTTWEEAFRLADHFVSQIRQDSRGEDFWALAAQDLLTCFILAAARIDGTLSDVQSWLADVTAREPARILAQHGFHGAARSVAGRQAGAPETRDGVYETARTAASCLSDPHIMAWVTPTSAATRPALDVTRFPESTDTLYLLSKDGAGSAAPLVAGLTDQVLRAAVRAAEMRGGRLDPPLLCVLDEAANICKISDLPQLYSHFGSRGILPITILQSYPQGARVWGEAGMAALWSAATIKVIGAGIDDAKLAEDLSRLVGEHDVPVGSRTRDGSGISSWQTSTQRRRILEPAQIRAIERGHALLFATGIPAAMIRLLPWYTGPHAAQLEHDNTAATQAITRRAQTDYTGGPR
jgi:type IV secretory pathway TraG/TraD family ATPase VirD4